METQRTPTWRDRSALSWRGRQGALATRGEVDGPKVAECKAALNNWRAYTYLVTECGYDAATAGSMIDSTTKTPGEVG
jgi:hypothetical protein